MLPLTNGEFLIAGRNGSVTTLRRYSPRGKLIGRFGDNGRVRIAGEVHFAATLEREVVLYTTRPGRNPASGLELIKTNGRVDTDFSSAGINETPEYSSATGVNAIAVRGDRIYLLVNSISTPPGGDPEYDWQRNFRIARFDQSGEFVATSGIVDSYGDPGDGGDLDEYEQRIWTTPGGVVFARLEQQVGAATHIRYSRWSAQLTGQPIIDREINTNLYGRKVRKYFVGQKFAPSQTVVN